MKITCQEPSCDKVSYSHAERKAAGWTKIAGHLWVCKDHKEYALPIATEYSEVYKQYNLYCRAMVRCLATMLDRKIIRGSN